MTNRDAILKLLGSRRGTFSPSEIADAIGTTANTVDQELRTLMEAGRIEKPARGRYQLVREAQYGAPSASPPGGVAERAAPYAEADRGVLVRVGNFVLRVTLEQTGPPTEIPVEIRSV